MIVETFLLKKFNEHREKSKEMYGDSDSDGRWGVLGYVLYVLLMIIWIYSIVDASKQRSDNKVLGILLAIFLWPVYWITKLAGVYNQ